jgi:hypothetical protein
VTPELSTLLAGIIGAAAAIGGVVIQRIFEQRDRRQEKQRELNEIARALFFEIEGFSRDYLASSKQALAMRNPSGPLPVSLKVPPARPFPIYFSNAQRIGEFSDIEVREIVTFFNLAASVASTLAEAVRLQTEIYVAHSNIQTTAAIQALYQRLDAMLPDAITSASTAQSTLAKRASISI